MADGMAAKGMENELLVVVLTASRLIQGFKEYGHLTAKRIRAVDWRKEELAEALDLAVYKRIAEIAGHE